MRQTLRTLAACAFGILLPSAALAQAGITGNIRDTSGEVVDLLYEKDFTEFRHQRIETRSTHGTGCTLSAAIAANLALGESLTDAIRNSIDFVHEAIADAPHIGSGHGPLNHFVGRSAANSRTSA